jgi:hypothetical protein
MANKTMKKQTLTSLLALILFLNSSIALSANGKVEEIIPREAILTNLSNLILNKDCAEDITKLEEVLKVRRPRNVFIEHWIVQESTNKKLLKEIRKVTNKYNSKLYFVTGKNTWFGQRAAEHLIPLYKEYGKYIDGIVLRIEPNRVNIWREDDDSMKVQVLNQMLDGYAAVYSFAKKIGKSFIVEFPFWLTDFQGPKRTFPDDACIYADKVIFLIDNEEKLNTINIPWNDITCHYLINLGKRATRQNDEKIKEIYQTLNKKLILNSTFSGYIIDSDSSLDNKIETDSEN